MFAALLGRAAVSEAAGAAAGAAESEAGQMAVNAASSGRGHGVLSMVQHGVSGAGQAAAGILGGVAAILGGGGPRADYPSAPQ